MVPLARLSPDLAWPSSLAASDEVPRSESAPPLPPGAGHAARSVVDASPLRGLRGFVSPTVLTYSHRLLRMRWRNARKESRGDRHRCVTVVIAAGRGKRHPTTCAS
ncbi:hypothetical protein FKP32DRAFT_16978 [Trametes sanguinea]|nr:hypothetical protein FKP32DRAFT_16978 [Trametes sanguinea]